MENNDKENRLPEYKSNEAALIDNEQAADKNRNIESDALAEEKLRSSEIMEEPSAFDEQTVFATSEISDPPLEENVKTEVVEKAGFWIRLCAYLIDVVVVFSLNAVVLSPVVFFQHATIFQWEYISTIGILGGIVYYMYFLFMTKGFGQTLGKMVIGIKVISSNDEEMTWGDAIFREVVGRLIYNVIFVLKFLYIVIAFTDEKKGVHDIIGNTKVVYTKS